MYLGCKKHDVFSFCDSHKAKGRFSNDNETPATQAYADKNRLDPR